MHQRSVPYENRLGLAGDGEPAKKSGEESGFSAKMVHKWTQRPYTVLGARYCPEIVPVGTVYEGIASWYGPDFHGKKTSSGEVYDMYDLSAAHKTLPMNTMIKVTSQYTKQSIVVRVNDRGPFVEKRIVDLSYSAGKKIGLDRTGIAPVTLEVLGYDELITQQLGTCPPPEPVAKVVRDSVPAAEEPKQERVTESIPLAAVPVSEVSVEPVPVPKQVESAAAPQPKSSQKHPGYVVQIGSFSKLEGAKKVKEGAAFVYSGRDVKIVSILKEKMPIYKVYVSGFDTRDEAKAFVQKNNINGAFIAQDD